MHSLGYRVNALSAFAVTALALICGIASFTDNFNSPSPAAELHALTINRFRKKLTGDDEVSLSLNVSTNLESIFTWNTKQVFVFLAAEYGTPKNALNQVSLWDSIIPSKELAKFQIHTSNKYRFIDQGSNLRGKDFNLTMHWHVMPKTGKMFADNLVIGGFRLPESYNKQKAVVSEDINSTNREVAVNVVPGQTCKYFFPRDTKCWALLLVDHECSVEGPLNNVK